MLDEAVRIIRFTYAMVTPAVEPLIAIYVKHLHEAIQEGLKQTWEDAHTLEGFGERFTNRVQEFHDKVRRGESAGGLRSLWRSRLTQGHAAGIDMPAVRYSLRR